MRILKLIAVGLTFICATNLLHAQTAGMSDADIKELLRDIVDKQKRAPGIVVGVVDKDGPKIFSHGKLFAGATNEMNGDTVFEIGSITKAFTGVLLAQMIQNEQVALGDVAQKYLPATVKLPTRDGKEISLRHLTTHTSGLPRMPNNFAPADPDNPYADYSVQQMYTFLGSCQLSRTPGERYEYSNLGAGLLGHILALKAGTNYEALVRKEICDPLKMADTRITLTPEMKKRLAAGHNSAGVRVKNWDLPTLAGAGALRSTANEMLKFLAANLGLAAGPLLPALEQSHISRFKNSDMEFAMGWHIRPARGARYVWHNGATAGYHSFAGFDPKLKRGVVVLANSANDIDDVGWHLLNPEFKVAKITARQVAKIDPKIYDQYVGYYEFPVQAELVVSRDGDRLLAKLAQQPALEIFPESETKFFVTAVDAQISFVKDTNGAVSHLILHQNGLDQKARRVRPKSGATGITPDVSPDEMVKLRVTFLNTVMLEEFKGTAIDAGDFDPRFAVTLRIDSTVPAITNLKSGTVATFSVHSPSMFLAKKNDGKYEVRVLRKNLAGLLSKE